MTKSKPSSQTYNLESLSLPKLAGNGLRTVAALLGFGPTRAMLLGRLLRDGGINQIRQWRLTEEPTLYPTSAPPDQRDTGAPTSFSPAGPFVSAAAIAAAYRGGETTPSEVAERSLAALVASGQGEKPLAAFIAHDPADLHRQAEESTARHERGAPLGPLDGVPIAVKDEVDQVPYPTTVGTAFLGQQPAARDATIVARLRAQGALLIGKANMHEIGINPTGLNVHHGVARNPYDRDHDTGGSSSGSAAAVAAGICPVAIGADGGGSIRIPAALCGVVGLKSTFGRISEDGAAPLTWSMGHLGPIGASVADCAAVYAAIAGADERDSRTTSQPVPTWDGWNDTSLAGVRLGVYPRWFEHATDDVVAANERMLEALCERGATRVEIEIPELDQMRVAHAVTILTEMATAMANHREHRGQLGAGVRINLTVGATLRGSDYVCAQRMRTRALAIFNDIYKRVDAVITPATAITAPPIPKKALPHGWSDLNAVTELMRYIVPGNLIGLPAISFPVGYSDNGGLPIAMQAMASHWNEALLFRVAGVAESITTRVLPDGYTSLL